MTGFDPVEQHEATDESAQVREARRKVKAEVTAGTLDVLEVLDVGKRGSGDKTVGHMHVGELLRAVEGIGPATSAHILSDAGVTDDEKHLNALTNAQRDAIKQGVRDFFAQHAASE